MKSKIPPKAITLAQQNGWNPDWASTSDIYLEWERVALDPLFFQALGKALRWPEKELTEVGLNPGWMHEAIAFYRLILTGGDTEKFWNDLLKTN